MGGRGLLTILGFYTKSLILLRIFILFDVLLQKELLIVLLLILFELLLLIGVLLLLKFGKV